MKINTEPIKNWFGFSRRERRATFILLILIVLIIGSRYLIPDSRLSVRDVTGSVISDEDPSEFFKPEDTSDPVSPSNNTKKRYRVEYLQKNPSVYRAVAVAGGPLRRENFHQYSSAQKKILMDINLSDSAQLVKLPGIGPVLSARIIKFRKMLGGFARIEQLKEVYGLPAETFEMIKNMVSADSTFITRVNINKCGYRELVRIHYFEKYEVTSILKYRQLKGRINNIGDLTDNKLITVDKSRKVGPYLKFDE
jgi:DNA uptake protein ComE-like DNA-binding protein